MCSEYSVVLKLPTRENFSMNHGIHGIHESTYVIEDHDSEYSVVLKSPPPENFSMNHGIHRSTYVIEDNDSVYSVYSVVLKLPYSVVLKLPPCL